MLRFLDGKRFKFFKPSNYKLNIVFLQKNMNLIYKKTFLILSVLIVYFLLVNNWFFPMMGSGSTVVEILGLFLFIFGGIEAIHLIRKILKIK